jgi:hypothetical protein
MGCCQTRNLTVTSPSVKASDKYKMPKAPTRQPVGQKTKKKVTISSTVAAKAPENQSKRTLTYGTVLILFLS